MRRGLTLALLMVTGPLTGVVAAGHASGTTTDPEPHVIVGIPDTGINPYHEDFYRPDLTDHPSTYIEGFPEDVQRLDLSVEEVHEQGWSYSKALSEDRDEIDAVEEGTFYWIPQTVFVAVVCTGWDGSDLQRSSDSCIVDDGTEHGTGTASSVVRESPNATIAFKQGSSSLGPLRSSGVPIDVYSVSWGTVAPTPFPTNVPSDPIYVKAAGNDPRSTLTDGWSGNPDVIAVGGAYPERGIVSDRRSEPLAANQVDVVSWYCRDVADANAVKRDSNLCGTSFAAPTVAGALAEVVYQVRDATGYTGTITADGMVNPDNGITTQDVREAMNRTATYDPTQRPADSSFLGGPRVDHAPWIQWGWGFYDHLRVDETLDGLLGDDELREKPLPAQLYMDATFQARMTLY